MEVQAEQRSAAAPESDKPLAPERKIANEKQVTETGETSPNGALASSAPAASASKGRAAAAPPATDRQRCFVGGDIVNGGQWSEVQVARLGQ
jgi:hypothetical protein